jgi:hypothetical protein
MCSTSSNSGKTSEFPLLVLLSHSDHFDHQLYFGVDLSSFLGRFFVFFLAKNMDFFFTNRKLLFSGEFEKSIQNQLLTPL